MKAFQTLSRNYDQYQGGSISVESEVSEDGLFVSEEEYWKKYYEHPDFSYEWKNGYLEEKPLADHKSYLMYKWFLKLADQYLTVHPVAEMTGLEIGFRLELPGDTSIRKPDMAIVLNDNPVMLHLTDCNFKGTFDMCIESLSYSTLKDIKRDTVDKKKEYQGIGVREYYILDSRGLETAFYRLNQKGKYQKIKQTGKDLIESEVLPGFRFRISDLYKQPSSEEMAEDEVYQDYVLPFYQKARQEAESERKRAEKEKQMTERERKRAEKAEQKAELERQRAEKAEQRAESLARKLMELGIAVQF